VKSRPQIEEVIGVGCMVVLTLITLGNVVTRYFTDRSFAWTEEISVFLIVVMTLAGAAAVAGRDGHIRIEYFYDGGSLARRRRLRQLAAAAAVLVFVGLGALFTVSVADEIRWSETSMGLGVPRWWFTVAIPPLCLAIAVRACQAGWRAWRNEPAALAPGAAEPLEEHL
jgi:TRAP-type C4-dicarboxylate transport system permease small subunit